MAGSLVYNIAPGAIQTTNATPLTTQDCLFFAAGAVTPTRNVGLLSFWPGGRGAGLSLTSGISYRLEKWTTTAASGGTGITPAPSDIGFQAAKHTSGYAVATVTSGTGGPTLLLSILSGATGPTAYVAPNPAAMHILQGWSGQSIDVFCVSGTASLSFEEALQTVE